MVSFKLLRTDTASKRPTSAQLAVGELGLNYEASTGGLYFEDDDGNVRKIGPMEVGSSAPNATPAGSSGNSVGELWLDNDSGHVLKYYTGSTWVSITNAGDAGSDTQVIFNNSGSLSGDANFTFDATNDVLSVTEVEGRLDGPVVFEARSSGALSKGDVVYVSSVSGDFPVVSKAQANSASTMPACGIVNNFTSGADESVSIISLGTLSGVDTATQGYSLGDALYVSPTTAGALTTTRPTGESNFVQSFAHVQKVNASSGQIKVGPMGTNNIPNLNSGNIFVGNGSNQAVTDAFTDVLNTEAGISSAATSTALTIDSSGDTSLTGQLTVTGNINANGNIVGDGSTTISGVNSVSAVSLTLNSVNLSSTATELNYLDGSTPGTATASNAVVLDSSKNITGINSLNSTSLSAGTTASPFQASAANDAVTKDFADSTYILTGISDTSTGTTLTLSDSTATFTSDIVQTPSSSVDPASNGDLVVEATSNTTITFKLKGDDGTVRTGTITLS
tara:strand:+ start:6616 stop:8136 length:1521 start_codon:yes stop_codon:yes gene_type:complete